MSTLQDFTTLQLIRESR